MTYVYKIHNPQLWVYGLMMMGIIGICAYFLLDLQMMITRRSHVYAVDSWYEGFIDLQTDILFLLWRDLFTKNPYEDAIDTEAEMRADKQTPIHITVEEANNSQLVNNPNVRVD